MEYIVNKSKLKNKDKSQILFHVCTALGFVLIGIFILYGIKKGIFTSTKTFSTYIISLGLLAPVVFTLVQGVQVVIPILPGAIGCAVGVIAFGPVWGFLLNYIGISLGSIAAFLIAKKYGMDTVKKLVKEQSFQKYLKWIHKGHLFDKFFTLAIFAPVAPDDLLCYLAGLTKMSLKKFTAIIMLGKPFSILLYSLGTTSLLKLIAF